MLVVHPDRQTYRAPPSPRRAQGLRQLFSFHDPLHPEFTDEMHEWHFRSGLDRFVWLVGMLQAFHMKGCSKLVARVEAFHSTSKRALLVFSLFAATLAVFCAWWAFVFRHKKRDYNVLHPFTSFVPITCFLILRNIVAPMRQRYLWLFAYMGRFTLETYIFQFHIWMKTTGVNGSPKHLMLLIPSWVPGCFWVNLMVTTSVYIVVSIRMFHLTTAFRDILIPDGLSAIVRRWASAAAALALCWISTFAIRGSSAA